MPDNIPYRVEQLEACMDELQTDVKLIMTNHLPHLQASSNVTNTRLDNVDRTLKWILGLIASGIFAMIGIIVSILL